MPNTLIDWLNDEGLPYMCYEATLNLLNSLIGSSMFRKYDIVELLVRLFYRVARSLQNQSQPELFTHTDLLLVLGEICCSLLLLRDNDQLLAERLLSSTNILETVLLIFENLEEASMNPIKFNITKA